MPPTAGPVVVVRQLPACDDLNPTQGDLDEAPPRSPRRENFLARRALTRRVVATRLGSTPATCGSAIRHPARRSFRRRFAG